MTCIAPSGHFPISVNVVDGSIGVTLTDADGRVMIEAVTPGGSAEAANLSVPVELVAIDGEPVYPKTRERSVEREAEWRPYFKSPPRTCTIHKKSKRDGSGLSAAPMEGVMKVNGVVEPASSAGVKHGDTILEINGTSVDASNYHKLMAECD